MNFEMTTITAQLEALNTKVDALISILNPVENQKKIAAAMQQVAESVREDSINQIKALKNELAVEKALNSMLIKNPPINQTYVLPCPFHKEKTGSFTIKAGKYHCFGCGVSGDVAELSKILTGKHETCARLHKTKRT